MSDLEKRFRRVMSSTLSNESLAASLEDEAASELLLWAEQFAKRVVDETEGLDDESAEKQMAPHLKAMRLFLRSIGRWVGEANSLDIESKLALWDRAGEHVKLLFGETFIMPPMADMIDQLSAGLSSSQIIQRLKKHFEENELKG